MDHPHGGFPVVSDVCISVDADRRQTEWEHVLAGVWKHMPVRACHWATLPVMCRDRGRMGPTTAPRDSWTRIQGSNSRPSSRRSRSLAALPPHPCPRTANTVDSGPDRDGVKTVRPRRAHALDSARRHRADELTARRGSGMHERTDTRTNRCTGDGRTPHRPGERCGSPGAQTSASCRSSRWLSFLWRLWPQP
jgi:hypothetical protein